MRSCEFLPRVFRFQCEFIRRVAMLNSPVIAPRSCTFYALKFHRKRTVIRQPSAKQFHIFSVKLRVNTNIAKISRRTTYRCPDIALDDSFA